MTKLIFLINNYFDEEKYKFIITLFLKIFLFLMILFIKKISSFNNKIIVEIDNNIKESLFEQNIDFSNYSTEIKMIAVYYPEFLIEKNKFLSNYCNLSSIQNETIKKGNNLTIYELIFSQVNLAKKHGIYGFGIIYYWFSGNKCYDEVLNIFFENQEIDFPYFIILKNDYLNISISSVK